MDNQAPNPYASPALVHVAKPDMPPAERVRRAHLGHEASLQSVGALFLLWGALIIFACLANLVLAICDVSGANYPLVVGGALAAVGVAVSAICIATGLGLRRLDPKYRSPAVVLSVIGLIAFPCGTIVNMYVLYLLLSRKGQAVFTADYAEIRRQTPHVRYGMPLWNWIVLGAIAAAIGGYVAWRKWVYF